MEQQIIAKIETIREQMLEGIKRIVSIPSVESEACENAPYGKGVKEALDQTLSLAQSLGFDTHNIDNHIGYAQYGQGDEYVCAIGHLDVVPEGKGWKHPPFSAHEEDGVIYARGILDNKGPILSCLYALYALKEVGIPLQKEVRIIFGCDEESGFEDLRYYLQKEKPPLMGFTPDCKYPVVYAERGRAMVEIEANDNDTQAFFTFLNEFVLNAKTTGDAFGIQMRDEEFGSLEVRNYKVSMDSHPTLRFAISYPASGNVEEIVAKIQESVPQYTVRLVQNYDPVFFEKDCALVKHLQKAYECITKEDGTPVTTTGGTYAKLMPNIVPFGPSFPGQKGIGHQPNEWMKVEDIITNAKIYALSLYYLAK